MPELVINIAVTYKGRKARSLVPGCTSQDDVVRILRTDLTILKCPHPKASTIELHSVGRITCYWQINDYNPLIKKLRQIDNEQNTELYQKIKSKRSIEILEITEEPVSAGYGNDLPLYHSTDWSMSVPQIPDFQVATVINTPRENPGGSNSDPLTSGAYESEAQPEAASSYAEFGLPSLAQYHTHDVEQLTHSLRIIREHITAAKTIENTLLDRLERLGASAIRAEIADQDTSSSITVQLQAALETERKRRIEVEQTLQDVERECKEPFVVPALLKAFIDISKLTSESYS